MSAVFIKDVQGEQVYLDNQTVHKAVAKAGETYNLIDPETGDTPKDIDVRRDGKDLLLQSESLDVVVHIESFFSECQAGNPCYAILDVEGENGELGYATITQSGKALGKLNDSTYLVAGQVGTISDSLINLDFLDFDFDVDSTWLWAGAGVVTAVGVGLLVDWPITRGSGDNNSSTSASATTSSNLRTALVKSAETEPTSTTITLSEDAQTLSLNYSDLISNNQTAKKTVVIKGENNDKVDLGGSSVNGLADGDGVWTIQDTAPAGYQAFQHSSDTLGQQLVLIQEGVQIV